MNTKGYTLLEVMLFLAISGAIALTAFVGLGPRLANARFTSSIRSLEANFTQEMQESQSGLNVRDSLNSCTVGNWYGEVPDIKTTTNTESGTSDDCVINGRLAVFKDKFVDYHPIVSLRKSKNIECDLPSSYISMLACYRPTVVRVFQSPAPVQYTYPYKVKNISTDPITATANPAVNAVVAFGYTIEPNSGVSYRFFHTKAGNLFSE